MLINQILLEKNLFLTKLETLMATLSYNYFQDADKEKKGLKVGHTKKLGM